MSSGRARKHAVAKVQPSIRGYDVLMTHRCGRDLRFSPRADLRGYRFDFGKPKGPPVRDADDDGEIVDDDPTLRDVPAARLTKLPLEPATVPRLEKLLR